MNNDANNNDSSDASNVVPKGPHTRVLTNWIPKSHVYIYIYICDIYVYIHTCINMVYMMCMFVYIYTYT